MIGGVLSGAPERAWPDGFVHHGVRALVLLLLAGGLAVLFPSGRGTPVGPYHVGTVADEDVLAEVGFDVPKDSVALERERQEAAAAVVPTFVYQPDAADSARFALVFLFARIDSAAASGGTAGIAGVLSAVGIESGGDQLEALAGASARNRLRDRAAAATRRFLPQGVMAPGAASGLAADSVRVVRDRQSTVLHRDMVLSGREFYDRAVEGLGPGPEEGLLRSILGQVVNMSLVLDGVRTERDRRRARDAVPLTAARIVEGEAIVRANQQLGDADVRRLEAYRAELRARGRTVDRGALATTTGALILNTLLLGVFGVLVFLYRRDLYRAFRSLCAVAGTFALYFLAAFLLAAQGAPAAALPVTFVAVTLAILWDGRLALAAAFVLAAVTAIQEPFATVHDFATVLAGGAAAALVVRAYRRLAQTWVFIAVVAAAYAVVILGLQLRGAEFALWPSLGAALAGTVMCTILAVGFLPVFEWLTGITTDQTLIAWADANRPLMRSLAVEAPGTYAHTMQVAALAEAGADAVGANALLCRAGAYYHDVGKIKRPGCFIENQQDGDNPHDRMEPAESAAVVREHVEEGLRLARRAKVPKVLTAFIAEHHGDQFIGFFYRKAMERAEEGADRPDPSPFRYPGPRPQSRETGIAMLADAVESAARALKHPTRKRIEGLIEKIFAQRLADGQLDDTGLTLRDIAALKARFATVLGGVYHRRIDYPQTEAVPEGPPDAVEDDGDASDDQGAEDAAATSAVATEAPTPRAREADPARPTSSGSPVAVEDA